MPLARWALLLSLAAFTVHAATKPKDKLPEHYARWLNQDVVYIITPQEKKEFLALTGDDARDKFMEDFWETRNPIRGASPNQFREEHYSRLAYANANFGRKSNTPGWMTDMGRTWIVFGKPDSRAPYTGYGQIYPLELWFYSNKTNNPAFPSFFYTLFFMPEDIGEYKLYRPYLDGPLKLVRGSTFNSNASVYRFLFPLSGELARAAFSLIPGEPLDTQDYSVSMGSDMLVTRIQNYANDPFYVKRINQLRTLRSRVTSNFFVQDGRPLDVSLLSLADPLGQFWLDYSVLVSTEDLGEWDAARKNMTVESGYKLKNDRGDVIVEDNESRSYPASEGTDGKFRPFQVANRVPLVPGHYKLEVEILNRKTSRTYRVEKVFDVGEGTKPAIYGPVLISSAQQAREPKPTIPFQYFGAQFVPGVQFGNRDGLRVLLQIQSSQPQDYQIEYVLAHPTDRTLRKTFTDDVHAGEFRNGTLLKSKAFALGDLPVGDYRLITNLRDAKAELISSSNQAFRLVAEPQLIPIFFSANSERIGELGLSAYVRGLETLALGNSAGATAYLRQSVEQNPKNPFALQLLVQNYYREKSFKDVTALYKKVGMVPFSGSPETVAQLVISLWNSGDPASAREALQFGVEQYPGNTLLAATSKSLTK